MQMRPFGRTGIEMSVIGLGCGAVGGLMVRGDRADQERVVTRALETGVNYFDTAAQYGLGASETNLGRVLAAARPDVLVGTKVLLTEAALGDIAGWTARSLEDSLRRLGMERVDLFHLHNPIGSEGARPFRHGSCWTRSSRHWKNCASRARRASSASRRQGTPGRCST